MICDSVGQNVSLSYIKIKLYLVSYIELSDLSFLSLLLSADVNWCYYLLSANVILVLSTEATTHLMDCILVFQVLEMTYKWLDIFVCFHLFCCCSSPPCKLPYKFVHLCVSEISTFVNQLFILKNIYVYPSYLVQWN